MPARSKVQNTGEAVRWIEEGKSYSWIVAKYLEKYGIETTTSMWATFRHRQGLDRQITRDTDLIPWAVDAKHRWKYPLTMLRYEARSRAGHELKPDQRERLDNWKATLEEKNRVVYYDPDTEAGFFLVPREETDTDLIRAPKELKAEEKAAEVETED
ncbi:hypothetical protein [Streptomyces sp. NPDC057617]|uniref:hypothetical protein n=1 Tax=Streptomyces sp. NPDC057617 TaxID=3346184 RepID=UPI0036866A0D